MRDHVDPQPRLVATADAAVEQVDVRRDFGEQRIERFVEQFKARKLGVAQFDDDAGAFRGLDPRLPDRLLERARLGVGAGSAAVLRLRPHMAVESSSRPGARQINHCFHNGLGHSFMGAMPYGRAQPRPSSVLARGRYSQATQPGPAEPVERLEDRPDS